MTRFLLRRFVSSAVLVAIAASLAYLLAAAALNPRANYENRRPAPPKAVIDARLTELNLNDETPLLERYATWAKGVLHGDLGKTWDGDDVSDEIGPPHPREPAAAARGDDPGRDPRRRRRSVERCALSTDPPTTR